MSLRHRIAGVLGESDIATLFALAPELQRDDPIEEMVAVMRSRQPEAPAKRRRRTA